MRLICPNCGAQYEINAALVPEAGRDVQCSACGHTWFQRRETVEEAVAQEAGVTAPVQDETLAAGGDPADGAAAAASVPAPEPEPEPEVPEPEIPEPPRLRRPDQAALAILREEAEREAEARRREARGLETQGDLGLTGSAPGRGPQPAGPTPADIAAAATGAVIDPRPAPAAPEDIDLDLGADEAAAKGSDVFPDIEEINSSLSAAEHAAMSAQEAALVAETERSSRLGFRIGFLTVVAFVAILIVLYAFAPRLAEEFPGLRPALSNYVDWANARRDGVDALIRSAASAIGAE